MTLAEIKKNLIALLTQDIGIAIEKFSSILNSDSDLTNMMILKSSQYNGLKKEINKETKPASYITLRENQIRATVLDLINEIGESDIDMTAVEKNLQGVFSQKNTSFEQTIDTVSGSSNSNIYISYAWGGESEKIVNLLDAELQERNIKLIRDKRDLGYKGSITEFMKDIGKGNKIIVIISEKYLKSENCMFELTQIYENKDFSRRIFPIILEDSNIYSPISRIKYIKYWNDKITELDEAIKSAGMGLNMTQIQQELNNYGNIRAAFDNMAFILKDMNALTPEMHRNENFEDIYNQLVSG